MATDLNPSTGAASRAVPAAPVRVGLPVARWELRYRWAVVLTDLVIIAVTFRVGLVLTNGSLQVPANLPGALAAVTALILVGGLVAARAWDGRVLGQGAEEFRRLGVAVGGAIIALGLVALAAKIWHVRPWVFGVLPAAGVALLVGRQVLRRVLHAQRRRGHCLLPVLAAGDLEEVAILVTHTRREPYTGYRVEAVCTPGAEGDDGGDTVAGVPVVGDLVDVADRVRQSGYRVVAVTPAAYWTRRRLRDLAWELEDAPVELVVAPVLMEVTGPRLHVAPVDGLTLLRVSRPTFSGARFVVKSMVDRLAALVVLTLLFPLLVLVAAGIWAEDRGPVFFRQTRVGRDGLLFNMVKFRSMAVGAEARKAELAVGNEGSGPLFKLRRDPRVTRIGALLRRYSLDELPQLFNVLLGNMSMVGPRPPLPEEVQLYAYDAQRRLLVKPGVTGLWQVNGRSDLSWEDSVRLDLRYVENWSLALDLVILWKTIGAVLRGKGSY